MIEELQKAIREAAQAGVDMLRKSQMSLFDWQPTHTEKHERKETVRHLANGAAIQVHNTTATVHVAQHHSGKPASAVVETPKPQEATMEPQEKHGLPIAEYARFARIAGGVTNWEIHGKDKMGMGEFKRRVADGEYPELVQAEIDKEKTAKEKAQKVTEQATAKLKYATNTTEMPAGTPIKTVTYKITKVGRKWMEAIVPGKGYKAQIEINANAAGFELGKEYTFLAGVHAESTKYGTTFKIYPVSQDDKKQANEQQAAAKNTEEIKKWLGYVEDKATREGYVYSNGVAKLKELGISNHPELHEKMKVAVASAEQKELKTEINRAFGYIETNLKDYWYGNGEIKVNGIIKQMQQKGMDTTGYTDKLAALKEQYKAKEVQKPQAQPKLRTAYPIHNAPPLNTPLRERGKVLVYESSGQAFRIDEDMPSMYGSQLLGHEGEKAAYFYYRDATPEEVTQLEVKEQAQRDRKQAQTNLKEIAKKIASNGEHQTAEQPKGEEIVFGGKENRIYGGGEWFVIGDKHIWYVRNNGMDGDNWSNNNVQTGGAGATGYRVPATEALAAAIRENFAKINN